MKNTEALDRNGIQALNFKCIFFFFKSLSEFQGLKVSHVLQ